MKNPIELIILGFIIYWVFKYLKNKFFTNSKKNREAQIDAIIEAEKMKMANTIYAKDFYSEERNLSRRNFDTRGVYIFTNLKNNKKYVGQSINILMRVRTHLKGRGSDNLYKDIKRGDKFTIQFVRLIDTHFRDLDSLEKYHISKNNSYVSGYNKTRGNG